jgi:hypothetical protein
VGFAQPSRELKKAFLNVGRDVVGNVILSFVIVWKKRTGEGALWIYVILFMLSGQSKSN